MLNRVVLVGRLTRDPELRRTAGGAAVASFTIAMNRNFTNQNGERQSDFIPCVVWNKAAENVARYCQKGALVGVDGRLQSRSYEDQTGRRVYVVEVVADSVQFLESRANAQTRQANPGYQQNSYAQPQAPANNRFNDNLYDMQGVDIEKEFDNEIGGLTIMDDDIQF